MEAFRSSRGGRCWFPSDEDKRVSFAPGHLADLAVLSSDYFSIPEEEIKRLESVLTIVGGRVVYATAPFAKLAPPQLPGSPDWSSVKTYGGFSQHKKKVASAESQLPAAIKPSETGREPKKTRSGFGEYGV